MQALSFLLTYFLALGPFFCSTAPQAFFRPDRRSPTPSRAEAVKVWPAKRRARGKVGATANLDSSCARRLCNTGGSGRRNGLPGRTKKPIKKARMIAALKPLDNIGPIQDSRTEGRARPTSVLKSSRCRAMHSMCSVTVHEKQAGRFHFHLFQFPDPIGSVQSAIFTC